MLNKTNIDISHIDDFENLPFKTVDNIELKLLKKSVGKSGII